MGINYKNKINTFDILFVLFVNGFYTILLFFGIKYFSSGKEGNLYDVLLILLSVIQFIISAICQIVYNIKSELYYKKNWYKRKTKIFIFSNMWITLALFPFLFDPISIITFITFVPIIWYYKYKLMLLTNKQIPSCNKLIKHLIWKNNKNI